MTGFLEGFDLGRVREVRIRSFTVGPGQSAQVIALVIEIWVEGSPEPELVEVDYGDEGPAVASVQAVMRNVNRQLRERRGEAPSP